jgi:transcriptional regulator with XRE-family HTH domain
MDRGSGGSRLAVDEIAAAYARELTGWRERRLLSKRGLAEAMGYDRSYVSHVEACNQAPSDEFTRKAERVLDCDGALWCRWEAYAIARRRQRRALATRQVVPRQALWTTAQLAGMLSIAPRRLRGWRSTGFGPAWVNLGRFVRYDPAEVRRWLAEECSWQGATSTSWGPISTDGGAGSRPKSGACLDAAPEAVTLSAWRGGGTGSEQLRLVPQR